MEPTEEPLKRMLAEAYASRTDEILGIKNPYHRIGTLEGAIKAALPYFEEAVLVASKYDRLSQSGKYTKDDMRQVIANLKGIIEND